MLTVSQRSCAVNRMHHLCRFVFELVISSTVFLEQAEEQRCVGLRCREQSVLLDTSSLIPSQTIHEHIALKMHHYHLVLQLCNGPITVMPQETDQQREYNARRRLWIKVHVIADAQLLFDVVEACGQRAFHL
jgi:hypothetical protein